MPDQTQQKRVNVRNINTGQVQSLPADQVVAGMDQGWFPVDAGGTVRPESPDVWNWANRGLLTPDQVLRIVGRPDVKTLSRPVGLAESTQPATQMPRNRQEVMARLARGERITAPEASTYSRFWPQMDVEMARYTSGATSPASLGMMGLSGLAQFPKAVAGVGGPLAKLVGTIGTTARGVRTGAGLYYGAQGGMEALDALQNPDLSAAERAEKLYGGASQMAGGIPAITETRTALSDLVSSRFPVAAPRGEDAFVGALDPPKKEVGAVRAAYRRLKPELIQANVTTLPTLKAHAGQQRLESAQELNRRLAAANPQARYLDPRQTAVDIRNLVTPFMRRQTTVFGERDPTRRFLERKAADLQMQMMQRPVDIQEAEQMVQNINQQLALFHQKEAAGQQVDLTHGDVLYREGLHDSLQSQIDQRMSGYKDLKLRYGAWKDLHRAAQNREDDLAKSLGNPNTLTRRIWEGLGMSAAALMRGDIFRGLSEVMAGRAMGDIMARRASDPSHLLELSYRTPRAGMRPLARSAIAVAQPVVAGARSADYSLVYPPRQPPSEGEQEGPPY